LRGVGTEDKLLEFETTAKHSPLAQLRALDQLQNDFGNTADFREKVVGLYSLRADALGKLTDEQQKAFGSVNPGAFASRVGLPGHRQEVSARQQVIDEIKSQLASLNPEDKGAAELTNQLSQAQLNLFGSKSKVIGDLQQQFSNASQIAQLRASTVQGLGP